MRRSLVFFVSFGLVISCHPGTPPTAAEVARDRHGRVLAKSEWSAVAIGGAAPSPGHATGPCSTPPADGTPTDCGDGSWLSARLPTCDSWTPPQFDGIVDASGKLVVIYGTICGCGGAPPPRTEWRVLLPMPIRVLELHDVGPPADCSGPPRP